MNFFKKIFTFFFNKNEESETKIVPLNGKPEVKTIKEPKYQFNFKKLEEISLNTTEKNELLKNEKDSLNAKKYFSLLGDVYVYYFGEGRKKTIINDILNIDIEITSVIKIQYDWFLITDSEGLTYFYHKSLKKVERYGEKIIGYDILEKDLQSIVNEDGESRLHYSKFGNHLNFGLYEKVYNGYIHRFRNSMYQFINIATKDISVLKETFYNYKFMAPNTFLLVLKRYKEFSTTYERLVLYNSDTKKMSGEILNSKICHNYIYLKEKDLEILIRLKEYSEIDTSEKIYFLNRKINNEVIEFYIDMDYKKLQNNIHVFFNKNNGHHFYNALTNKKIKKIKDVVKDDYYDKAFYIKKYKELHDNIFLFINDNGKKLFYNFNNDLHTDIVDFDDYEYDKNDFVLKSEFGSFADVNLDTMEIGNWYFK